MPITAQTPFASAPHAQSGREPGIDLVVLSAALAVFSAAMFVVQAPLDEVVRHLLLPDSDDAMRMVQVLDLVGGQGWLDKVQHRHLPPAGASMHWSRIVDLPLAAGILALTPLVGERLAAGLVALIWPTLLFISYLTGLWLVADRWFGRRAAWLAALAATQLATISLFAPGRVDHHNVQILAILGVVFALSDPAAQGRGAALRGIAAGLLAGASLAIGLETLPFVAAASLIAALSWVFGLKHSRERLMGFGGALALTAPVLFLLETAPSRWLAPYCDALSPPSLLLACLGGAGAALVAVSLNGTRSRRARLAGMTALAALIVAPFVVLFPQCLGDPLGDLPEIVRRLWLEKVAEALSLPNAMRLSPAAALAGLVPLAVAALYSALRARAARTAVEAYRDTFLAVFMALGVVIATHQLRGTYVASAVLPIIAGAALDRALRRLRDGSRPGKATLSLLLGLAMLGKVVGLPVAVILTGAGWQPSEAIGRHLSNCAEEASLKPLAELPPGTVLAPTDLGPTILLHTPHAIIAAPYHRAATGIEAALRGFFGSEADLSREVDRTGADYVALCRAWFAGGTGVGQALASGQRLPWLEPVVAGPGDLSVWRVLRLRTGS